MSEVPQPHSVLVGTSSWTAPSWNGPFYPPGLDAAGRLAHYAAQFDTVEVDSTWYRTPAVRTVDQWRSCTPDAFVFAAKVPQLISHEQVLLDCEGEMDQFLVVMRRLGDKLGPLLVQFPYFNREAFPNLETFLERLAPFLAGLPDDLRFAVEVRNKSWLRTPLFDLLRKHGIALAWIDQTWMPTAREWGEMEGAITADFLYVRWLGDRKGIEKQIEERFGELRWDQTVVDRAEALQEWVDVLRPALQEATLGYFYANNHYAGCAYQTVMEFESAWEG